MTQCIHKTARNKRIITNEYGSGKYTFYWHISYFYAIATLTADKKGSIMKTQSNINAATTDGGNTMILRKPNNTLKDTLKLYTLSDIEDAMGVTTTTLRAYIKAGRLKAVMIGGKWRVSDDNLRAFINGETGSEDGDSEK